MIGAWRGRFHNAGYGIIWSFEFPWSVDFSSPLERERERANKRDIQFLFEKTWRIMLFPRAVQFGLGAV